MRYVLDAQIGLSTHTSLPTDALDGLVPLLLQVLRSPTGANGGLCTSLRVVRIVMVGEDVGSLPYVARVLVWSEIIDQPCEFRDGSLGVAKIFHFTSPGQHAVVSGCCRCYACCRRLFGEHGYRRSVVCSNIRWRGRSTVEDMLHYRSLPVFRQIWGRVMPMAVVVRSVLDQAWRHRGWHLRCQGVLCWV